MKEYTEIKFDFDKWKNDKTSKAVHKDGPLEAARHFFAGAINKYAIQFSDGFVIAYTKDELKQHFQFLRIAVVYEVDYWGLGAAIKSGPELSRIKKNSLEELTIAWAYAIKRTVNVATDEYTLELIKM